MVFHWSLSESKSPQVSRTRLRILGSLDGIESYTLLLTLNPLRWVLDDGVDEIPCKREMLVKTAETSPPQV